MSKIDATELELNGVKYVRSDSVSKPISGSRAVVVVDRGWIFAGDVTRANGRIKLTRAVHVRSWEGVGFDGMVANPGNKVTIKKLSTDVDMPAEAELFCCPVADNWGI